MPVAALRTTLGCVLAAASLGVFTKAGADIPAVAIIGVPLVIGAFAFWLNRNRRLALRVGPTRPALTVGGIAVAARRRRRSTATARSENAIQTQPDGRGDQHVAHSMHVW